MGVGRGCGDISVLKRLDFVNEKFSPFLFTIAYFIVRVNSRMIFLRFVLLRYEIFTAIYFSCSFFFVFM